MRHDQSIRSTLSPRSRVALTLFGVLTAAGGVLWLTTLFAPPPRVEAPPITELAPQAKSAADFAELACVHLRLANQGVQADASAGTVREELAAARALAAEALKQDARFTGLSGGISALDEAVRNNDAPATRVGMKVALKECEAP